MSFFGFTIAGLASVAVSFAGFLIGMRVAKERADRPLLRTLYQDLYVHFRGLREAAERGRPKDYSAFELAGDRYVALMGALERDGRVSLLPNGLARKMTDIEDEVLVAGARFKDEISQHLVPVFSQVAESLMTKPKAPVLSRSYRSYEIGKLVLGQRLDPDATFEGREVGIGFELELSGSRSHQLHLDRERLTVPLGEALSRLEQTISAHEGSQLRAAELKAGIAKLTTLLEAIAARIKDPHPFLETAREAIPDLFRK